MLTREASSTQAILSLPNPKLFTLRNHLYHSWILWLGFKNVEQSLRKSSLYQLLKYLTVKLSRVLEEVMVLYREINKWLELVLNKSRILWILNNN